MLGFYSDGDTCWNCKHFSCLFLKHRGSRVANQIDYHRQYTCNKQRVSFWNYNQIIKDGSCGYFWAGFSLARFYYGQVEEKGNGFSYTPLYVFAESVGDEEGEVFELDLHI